VITTLEGAEIPIPAAVLRKGQASEGEHLFGMREVPLLFGPLHAVVDLLDARFDVRAGQRKPMLSERVVSDSFAVAIEVVACIPQRPDDVA
jgi:hypothetical protein